MNTTIGLMMFVYIVIINPIIAIEAFKQTKEIQTVLESLRDKVSSPSESENKEQQLDTRDLELKMQDTKDILCKQSLNLNSQLTKTDKLLSIVGKQTETESNILVVLESLRDKVLSPSESESKSESKDQQLDTKDILCKQSLNLNSQLTKTDKLLSIVGKQTETESNILVVLESLRDKVNKLNNGSNDFGYQNNLMIRNLNADVNRLMESLDSINRELGLSINKKTKALSETYNSIQNQYMEAMNSNQKLIEQYNELLEAAYVLCQYYFDTKDSIKIDSSKQDLIEAFEIETPQETNNEPELSSDESLNRYMELMKNYFKQGDTNI